MVSLYTLMGLSVERWLIICHPGEHSMDSKLTSKMVIISSWTLALAISAPPLIGWAYFAPESSGMRLAALPRIVAWLLGTYDFKNYCLRISPKLMLFQLISFISL
jgi:hypothetical protein